MPLLTPEQTVQLIKNGHNPDADHFAPILLKSMHEGEAIMQFMLTHVDPDHPDQAYGLVDFGHGKPRMSMVFIPQLERTNPKYDLETVVDPDYVAEYPVSVYAEAARMAGKITTGAAALQWAATRIELTKARDQFITPTGPAFLPFMPN